MKTLTQSHIDAPRDKAVLTMLVIILSTMQLYARLGESGDEIAKRFGEEQRLSPVSTNATMALYELESAWSSSGKPLGLSQDETDAVGGLFRILRTWNWERVAFHGSKLGDFRVCVILLDDKSVFEEYLRGETLSDQDVDALLKANSSGNEWQKVSKDFWKIIDPATKKPLRLAVTNGGSNLSFYTIGILSYCLEAAQITEDNAKKKKG